MLEGMVRKQTEKQAQTLDSWLEKHDREVPFPEGVRLHGDQDYMGDGKPCHRMDVYEPELNPKEGPVLVNFHGGGFLLGEKQVNRDGTDAYASPFHTAYPAGTSRWNPDGRYRTSR